MRTTLFCMPLFCLSLLGSAASAEEVERDARVIIKTEGRCIFTDGSSYYMFEKSGKFESGPKGKSGRTIVGTWTLDRDQQFVVEGTWGWMNGLSLPNDRRRMTLSFSPHEVNRQVPGKRPEVVINGEIPEKLYVGYFIIEELVKLPPPPKK